MQPQLTPIDQKQRVAILALIQEYRLQEVHPRLALTIKSINFEHPRSLDHRIWQEVVKLATSMQTALQEKPFLSAPPSLLAQGTIPLGVQVADQALVLLDHDHELTRGLLLVGGTGTGKTNLLTLLINHVSQLARVWLLDPKRDFRARAARDESFLVFGGAYNPLRIPPFMQPADHKERFINCFCKAFFSAEHGRQVLEEAFSRIYATSDTPSLQDLKRAVDAMYTKTETYSRRDAIRGISLRLSRMQQAAPQIFSTRHGVPAETFCQSNLYFPLETQSATAEFFWTFLVYQLFAYQQSLDERDTLSCFLAMDEGLSLWNAQAAQHAKIEGTPLLSEIASRGREYGLALCVTSTSVNLTDQLLKSNVYTRIAFNTYDGKESAEIARTFSLNPLQHQYFERRLTRGTCIVRLGDRWKDALLVAVPFLPYNKSVTMAEWASAQARTQTLIPNNTPSPVIVRVTQDSPNQSTTLLASKNEETDVIAPNSQPSMPITEKLKKTEEVITHNTETVPTEASETGTISVAPVPAVALNATERALLKSIGDDPAQPCTFCYRHCKLHLQAGDRGRKKLETLGLIDAEPMFVRAGRGGKAIGLRLTRNGYLLLGSRPPHGTRAGDSIQHEYCCRTLHRLIPASNLEFLVGDKSLDVLLVYKEVVHRSFLGVLQRVGVPLAPTIAFNDGALVAVEVEVSDPERSGPRNAVAAFEVGVSLTVIAVLPKAVEKTAAALRSSLSASLYPHVVLIDVLRLLDGLRGE